MTKIIGDLHVEFLRPNQDLEDSIKVATRIITLAKRMQVTISYNKCAKRIIRAILARRKSFHQGGAGGRCGGVKWRLNLELAETRLYREGPPTVNLVFVGQNGGTRPRAVTVAIDGKAVLSETLPARSRPLWFSEQKSWVQQLGACSCARHFLSVVRRETK